MKLRNHEIIGIILCLTGIADLYIMPKILSKSREVSVETKKRSSTW